MWDLEFVPSENFFSPFLFSWMQFFFPRLLWDRPIRESAFPFRQDKATELQSNETKNDTPENRVHNYRIGTENREDVYIILIWLLFCMWFKWKGICIFVSVNSIKLIHFGWRFSEIPIVISGRSWSCHSIKNDIAILYSASTFCSFFLKHRSIHSLNHLSSLGSINSLCAIYTLLG